MGGGKPGHGQNSGFGGGGGGGGYMGGGGYPGQQQAPKKSGIGNMGLLAGS